MGWFPCRKCGELRKIGDFVTEDGENVRACLRCGDPEYYDTSAREAVVDEEARDRIDRRIGELLPSEAREAWERSRRGHADESEVSR